MSGSVPTSSTRRWCRPSAPAAAPGRRPAGPAGRGPLIRGEPRAAASSRRRSAAFSRQRSPALRGWTIGHVTLRAATMTAAGPPPRSCGLGFGHRLGYGMPTSARDQGGHPRRGPGHPVPARDQGDAQGDAAGRRQAGHPVRRGGGGRRRARRRPDDHRPQQAAIEDHFDRATSSRRCSRPRATPTGSAQVRESSRARHRPLRPPGRPEGPRPRRALRGGARRATSRSRCCSATTSSTPATRCCSG